MNRLEGRVAAVFGAGSSGAGLSNGQAAAMAYARAGAVVACIDLDLPAAETTLAMVEAQDGKAIAVRADVTDEADVVEALRATEVNLGRVDILHNNVGVAITGGLEALARESWDRAFALNVTGAFLTCKHALPGMLAAGRGAIVNVSSIASVRAVGYDFPAYMASKAALNQLTVSIAIEHAHAGIRANAIVPGLIDTPLVGGQLAAGDLETARAARNRASPTGRMGTPSEVAEVAVFLASDAASYVNGVLLPVDGGLSARAVASDLS